MTDVTAASIQVRPAGRYHSDQITAHWIVVFLLAFQFVTGGAMAAAMEAGYLAGALPSAGVIFVHGTLGTSILLVMLWRVSLRVRFGAPPPPETEPTILQYISRSVHFAFYGLLIAMPLAGIAAVFTLSETVGTLHALTSKLLIALIVAHVAGGLWHTFKRDGIIKRVLSGQPPRTAETPSDSGH